MPIETITMGKHEDVKLVKFGAGDIRMLRARVIGDSHETMILFNEQEVHPIGHEDDSLKGKHSDELEKPELVFQFTNPESITALIHSLIELQKEVFSYVASNNKP